MSKDTTTISKSFFPPFGYAAKELVTALVQTFLSPFGIVAGIIVILGLVLTVLRFTGGLATVTNLSDYNAWGIWIGFDLLTGVALAAGGFVTSVPFRSKTCPLNWISGIRTCGSRSAL